MNYFLLLVVCALATARTWRLLAIDEAGFLFRQAYFAVLPRKAQQFGEDLLSCPFCMGFWIGLGWLASGMAWGNGWGWQLAAGAFALNFISAQLNAWLDMKPITDNGGEINVEEGTEADNGH